MQLIDSHYDYSSRIGRTNGPSALPDRILLFDPIAVFEATVAGLPKERLVAVGNPAWEGLGTAPAVPENRVLFASQPIAADMGNRLGYTERSALRLLLDTRKLRPDLIVQVLLALHPREDPADMPINTSLKRIASAKIGIERASIVLGMFSSVLIEAALAGRRVISLQPGAQGADMCVLSRHGYIPRVQDVDGMLDTLCTGIPAIDEFRGWYAKSLIRLDKLVRSMTT